MTVLGEICGLKPLHVFLGDFGNATHLNYLYTFY